MPYATNEMDWVVGPFFRTSKKKTLRLESGRVFVRSGSLVQVWIVWIVIHEHLGEGVIHGICIPNHDLALLGQIILDGACTGTKAKGQES